MAKSWDPVGIPWILSQLYPNLACSKVLPEKDRQEKEKEKKEGETCGKILCWRYVAATGSKGWQTSYGVKTINSLLWLNIVYVIPFITVAKSKMYWQGVKSTALGV